jgi:simple sugar transport system ATP-binding protein
MILQALLGMNQELGTTIICVSSELGELKQICDRIVVMYEGQNVAEYSPCIPDVEFSLAFSGQRVAERVQY